MGLLGVALLLEEQWNRALEKRHLVWSHMLSNVLDPQAITCREALLYVVVWHLSLSRNYKIFSCHLAIRIVR